MPNSNHNQTDLTEEEISLIDIIDFFKNGWKFILATAIVTTLIGTGYTFIATPRYQATAVFQTAKVADKDVEPPNVLIEKIKIPTYFSQKTFDECGLSELSEPGVALSKRLNPTLSKTAPFITISYKSKSPEIAKNCLINVIADIATQQNEIAKPLLDTKKNQLNSLKDKLLQTENLTKSLSLKAPKNFDFNDSKFSANSLLLATLLNKESEMSDLQNEVNNAEIALIEPQTKGTYLTTPIYMPNVPVEPKVSLIILGSALAGLFLGIIVLLIKKSWRKIYN